MRGGAEDCLNIKYMGGKKPIRSNDVRGRGCLNIRSRRWGKPAMGDGMRVGRLSLHNVGGGENLMARDK